MIQSLTVAPLTEIFQDLVVQKVVLTNSFYEQLSAMADGAVKFANAQRSSMGETPAQGLKTATELWVPKATGISVPAFRVWY